MTREKVEVVEVGLRDGLQILDHVMPTADKIAWLGAGARGRCAPVRGGLVRAAEADAADGGRGRRGRRPRSGCRA